MRNFSVTTQTHTLRIDLEGRLFLPAEEREARCRVVALSPQGASLECELAPAPGAAMVLYIDGLSRFEGVAQADSDGWRMAFVCSEAKRERTAEQIAIIRENGIEALLRRHERSSRKGIMRFTRANGQIVSGEVIDISLGGAAIKTTTRPPIGECVLIAQTAGRVCRHHENGIGIEFLGKAVLS